MLTILFIGVLLLLFMVSVPVSFSLGITSIILMWVNSGELSISTIAQTLISSLNGFVILAVPLFILAAKLMNTSGITDRIFNFANVLVGYLPGGLGHVNVASSIMFAGMSGAAVSDAAGLGQVEIRAMRKAGFDNGFSTAVTAASSTVGPLIPPSLPMVIYGVTAGASVGGLFLAGIVPGLIMGLFMMLLVGYLSYKRGYPREKFPNRKEFWESFKSGILPLLTPIIIIGGIFSGSFTATKSEAKRS